MPRPREQSPDAAFVHHMQGEEQGADVVDLDHVSTLRAERGDGVVCHCGGSCGPALLPHPLSGSCQKQAMAPMAKPVTSFPVVSFKVEFDGSLTNLGAGSGLPVGSAGLAAN